MKKIMFINKIILNITKINYQFLIFKYIYIFYFQFNLSAEYVGLIFLIYPAVYAMTAPLWGWICDVKVSQHSLYIFILHITFFSTCNGLFSCIKNSIQG